MYDLMPKKHQLVKSMSQEAIIASETPIHEDSVAHFTFTGMTNQSEVDLGSAKKISESPTTSAKAVHLKTTTARKSVNYQPP